MPDLSQGAVVFDASVAPELAVERTKTGHLLVRPRINGRDAGWFIFDTGAGICVVSTPHAAELELAPAGDIAAIGTGGGENAKLYRARELALGPLTSHDHPVMLSDLSFLRPHLERDIAGVIGFGVLSRCVVELEIDAPRIALHDPASSMLQGSASSALQSVASSALEGARWAPLALEGRVPTVTASFEGREGRFRLDTGANSAVTFYEPAVRKWNLLEGRALTDGKLGGVGGFLATKEGALASLELAGMRREDVAASFAVEAKGTLASDALDGQIGAGFLRHFVLCLDYPGERFALRPRAVDPAPAEPGAPD